MNCDQAKKIDLTIFLRKKGIIPVKENESKAIYISPLRKDQKPSFIVDKRTNLYFDYGTGEGGSIIDLGTKLLNCSVTELLNSLNTESIQTHQVHFPKYESKIVIRSVEQCSSRALITYAENRGISHTLLIKYCKEVYYEVNTRKYYALGFKNLSGYELRNAYFKGCSAKNISFIDNKATSCILFEGFFNFLSWLVIFSALEYKFNHLILNSINNLNKARSFILQQNALVLYLDNDSGGINTTDLIKSIHPKCRDASTLYYPFNDLNNYLIVRQKQSKFLKQAEAVQSTALLANRL